MLAGPPRSARCCRIDGKDATGETLAVEAFHGRFQIRGVLDFHEAKTTGMARNTVSDHLGKRYRMTLLLKPLS